VCDLGYELLILRLWIVITITRRVMFNATRVRG